MDSSIIRNDMKLLIVTDSKRNCLGGERVKRGILEKGIGRLFSINFPLYEGRGPSPVLRLDTLNVSNLSRGFRKPPNPLKKIDCRFDDK